MKIDFPSESDQAQMKATFLKAIREVRAEQELAARFGLVSLGHLVDACVPKSGQSYKLRSLLFSLYNGKPADLSDTLALDWELKKSLCAVMTGFGYEGQQTKFFYDAMAHEFKAAGLLEWFLQEGAQ